MSKTAALVLAGFSFLLFSIPMAAQFNGLLPNGNVYAGVSYGQLTDVINRQSYRGFEASVEALPFTRFPRLGIVLDGSGYYRRGTEKVTQYVFLGGPRLSFTYGKWRPFVQAFGGIRHVNSVGFIYNVVSVDVGGGADYKLRFKNFSWRFQADYLYGHYGSAYQNDYRASTGPVWRF
ncbi:MAG TPA: hypothetical protein VFL34_01980 [Candidatus Sulfotelmatobacter sp.]|nr:hypothetical protein [Candidatus Sulfotelmatobacter sp.]